MKSIGLSNIGIIYIENINIPANVITEKCSTGLPSTITLSHLCYVESHFFSIGQNPTCDKNIAMPTNDETVRIENINAIILK